PEEEYDRRLDAVRTVAERFGIPLIEGVYDPQKFFDAVRGHEHEPENGMRRSLCCRLRLSDTARNAMKTSYDAIATTLTVGPMKKAHIINSIGKKEAEREGIEFVAGDWKKKDGFKHSCELTRALGIYRQHYCGCLFSMRKDERL
ncbi:MAG TPA: epoxyqueuosine reductase QueH, partial [Anaerolineae bacterium]|nr:epoxyqueuosine reductase QueH [Anaerolineae bacterium]